MNWKVDNKLHKNISTGYKDANLFKSSPDFLYLIFFSGINELNEDWFNFVINSRFYFSCEDITFSSYHLWFFIIIILFLIIIYSNRIINNPHSKKQMLVSSSDK